MSGGRTPGNVSTAYNLQHAAGEGIECCMIHLLPAFILLCCVPSAVFHFDSKYRSCFWLWIWIRVVQLTTLLDFLDQFEDQHFFWLFFCLIYFKWCWVGKGCLDDPSLRFFANSWKIMALGAAALAYFIIHPFHILSEKFQPKAISGQLTRSRQVTQRIKILAFAPWLQF